MVVAGDRVADGCGHCGSPQLHPNVYHGYSECLFCGWTTDSPTREERDAVLARIDAFGAIFGTRPHFIRGVGEGAEQVAAELRPEGRLGAGGARRTARHGGRHDNPGQPTIGNSAGAFRQATISMWWSREIYMGWTAEQPLEIPVTIVYRRPVRRLRQTTTAIVEQIIFELGDVPWPTQRKFWVVLGRRFREQTGLRLLRVQRWVDVNRPC